MRSTEAALRFVLRIRQEPALRREIAGLGSTATLDDVVRVARAHGLAFDAAALKTAIRHDWNMRWHRYAPDSGTLTVDQNVASSRRTPRNT